MRRLPIPRSSAFDQVAQEAQAPRRFTTREAFDAFADPDHEKLFMSIRMAPTGWSGEHWLGAFVSWQLLRAIRYRAQRSPTATDHDRDAAGLDRRPSAWDAEELRTVGGKFSRLRTDAARDWTRLRHMVHPSRGTSVADASVARREGGV
jgi:hypothetical protein